MILQKILPTYFESRANQTFLPPFEMDGPKDAWRSSKEWHDYPIRDYVYSFNNWAFRGEDYSQFKNQPVNICLGDSFVLNLGAPVEHSWPRQLAEHLDIPTLNFGIDGAGNDTIHTLYEFLIDYFDVQNTFVMYSFFHRRYHSEYKELKHDVYSDQENFDFFNKHKLENVYYTFLPPWCWSDSEKEYLRKNNPKQYLFYENFDHVLVNNYRSLYTTKDRYDFVKGSDWPPYEDFIDNKTLDNHVYNEIFVSALKHELFYPTNRDGFHLNYLGNKIVCDYFLNELNRTPN